MTKDFQDTLNKAGVPRLMQLIAQEMKEKKMI